jgi:hypothetical protein
MRPFLPKPYETTMQAQWSSLFYVRNEKGQESAGSPWPPV